MNRLPNLLFSIKILLSSGKRFVKLVRFVCFVKVCKTCKICKVCKIHKVCKVCKTEDTVVYLQAKGL